MSKVVLKDAFEVESKHGAFYTGGNVEWSIDGEHLFCQKGDTISVVSVSKGIVITQLGQHDTDENEDTINSFTLSNDDSIIITHHKSGLFKLWNWKENKLSKLWKSIHKGPVTRIAFCNENNLMASGGSDGTVRLWDLQHHACTQNLKGVQGVVSVLAFHPDTKKELLFAAGDDTKIHGWNLKTGEEKVLLSGHFSKVTSLSFYKDGNHLVSSGRDRVLILWNISTGTSVRVLPVFEAIEGIFVIPDESTLPGSLVRKKSNAIHVAGAGEKGIIKVWEMRSGREIYKQENSLVQPAKEEDSLSITHLLFNKNNNNFAVVSVDHNIIIHSLETFDCVKQLVGYSDEILDVVYLGVEGGHVAVATNSCDIKLYELSSMNCQLLSGHSDLVLGLNTSPSNPNLLVSSAKVTALLCSALLASVGSIALSQTSPRFFVSVSQDSCLKLWDLPTNLYRERGERKACVGISVSEVCRWTGGQVDRCSSVDRPTATRHNLRPFESRSGRDGSSPIPPILHSLKRQLLEAVGTGRRRSVGSSVKRTKRRSSERRGRLRHNGCRCRATRLPPPPTSCPCCFPHTNSIPLLWRGVSQVRNKSFDTLPFKNPSSGVGFCRAVYRGQWVLEKQVLLEPRDSSGPRARAVNSPSKIRRANETSPGAVITGESPIKSHRSNRGPTGNN